MQRLIRDFSQPSPEQLFNLLTGETEQTLRVGMLCHVKVLAILGTGVRVRLPSGLSGYIDWRQLNDGTFSPEEQHKIKLESMMRDCC